MMIALPNHDDLFWARDDKDRLNRQQREGWDSNRPAIRRSGEIAFARKNEFIALTQLLLHPRLKDGIVQIRHWKRGLPAGVAKFLIADMGTRGILHHRTGTRGRRHEHGGTGEPRNARIGRKDVWEGGGSGRTGGR